MNTPFVPYNLAALLKEKGFNEPCFAWYTLVTEKLTLSTSMVEHGQIYKDYSLAPTYDQVLDWLRVKHKIYIELIIDGWQDDENVNEEYIGYRAFVWQVGKSKPHHNDDLGMSDYHTILILAIKHAINLI